MGNISPPHGALCANALGRIPSSGHFLLHMKKPESSREAESLSIDRRRFLKMVGGAGALTATHGMLNFWPNQAQAQEYEEAMQQRRNIIIFTTDQQQELRWFPEGWEAENMPGLTRLRGKGVSFRRAYTNTAMCTPARTTLFTGVYPAQHKSVDTLSEGMSQSEEEHQLDPSLPNIGTVFASAGYDVVWKGKWHLSKGVELPDGDYTSDDIARYGMNGWNSPDAGGDAKLPNYGGGSINNDGRFFDGHTWQDPVGDPSDPDYMFTQADGPINAQFEQNSAMAFLREKIENPGGNPFCLIICLINPHDVLGVPGVSLANGGNGTYIEGGYYAREDGTSPWIEQSGSLEIQLPPTKEEHLNLNHKPDCQANFLAVSAIGLGPVVTDAKKREYINFYGNLMKLVDRYLVQMLDLLDGDDPSVDPLKAQELRDKSWVIFASDHGDMAMAHGGLRQKSFQIYEENANIPLIWSNPVDFPTGQDCHELVSHIDFMPTLCAMTGIDTESYDFRGVDYSSLIENPNGPAVQDSILFTFDDIWSGQDASGSPNGIVTAPNRLRALIEKDYKYVYYFDGLGVATPQDEFYDLRSNTAGGTDTDISTGLGTTGKAVEYTNYSQWAESQRHSPIAPQGIIDKRTQMEADLQTAMDEELQPLPPRSAVPPEQFDIAVYNWTDDQDQKQTELQITWMSRSTTQYQVQSSSNLITWDDLGDPMPGTNGTLWVNQSVSDKLFYRLAWSPLPDTPIPEPPGGA